MAEVVGVFCFFLAIVAVPMVSDAGFRDKMYRRLTCRPPRTAAARCVRACDNNKEWKDVWSFGFEEFDVT
jgi:hypothetical protein